MYELEHEGKSFLILSQKVRKREIFPTVAASHKPEWPLLVTGEGNVEFCGRLSIYGKTH